jgi:acetyltransferase-like isoleucine patch superfamily enzyme
LIKNTIRKIQRFFYYKKLWRSNKVKIANSAFVDFKTKFEGRNEINENVFISDSEIGYATYIHVNSKIQKCKIGRYCSIAPNVHVVVGNHPISKYVSTHPLLYSTKKFAGLTYLHDSGYNEYSYTSSDKKWLCEIGNDVWIGQNVLIINGCKIGDGAVIASGAVVVHDVEPYAIVGGVPAKVIKYRFNKDEINFLIEFKWWEKSFEWIKNNIEKFDDISFIKEIGKGNEYKMRSK